MSLKKQRQDSNDKINNVINDAKKKINKAKDVVENIKKNNPELVGVAKKYIDKAKQETKKINLDKFLTDMFHTLLHPVKYFSSIKSDSNYEDQIVKVLMYGLATGGIKILLSLGQLSIFNIIASLLFMPALAVIITFALSGIMLMFSYLTKGDMDFEMGVKSVASCIFMYPVAYTIYHLSGFYFILWLSSLLIDLYIMFLIYTATTHCLNADKTTAKAVFGIFAIMILVVHVSNDKYAYLTLKNPKIMEKHQLKEFKKTALNIENLQVKK